MKDVFMKRAFELSKKGEGFTSPNPCVGSVIVKNNKILAEGWHKKAGQNHAEIIAIKSFLSKFSVFDLKNSDLYITLEPCSHYGKTPPCVDFIIKYGFKNVFIGVKDCFEKVNGNGIKKLKKVCIKVEVLNKNNEIAKKILFLNRFFVKKNVFSMPYVILKAGTSLDGKIATFKGISKWITNEKARMDARIERSKCDCVLVGAGTIKTDNPQLLPYGKYKNKKLLKVIIDRDLSLDFKKYKIFKDKNIFVATTDLGLKKNCLKCDKIGIEYKSFGKDSVSVKKLLKFLAKEKDISSVFVEGGSEIHGLFHDAFCKDNNLLDEILFYISPFIMGGKDSLSVVGGKGINNLLTRKIFKWEEVLKIDDNLKLRVVR